MPLTFVSASKVSYKGVSTFVWGSSRGGMLIPHASQFLMQHKEVLLMQHKEVPEIVQ